MEFKEWLKLEVDKSGLTQQQIADAIGETQPSIYRIY